MKILFLASECAPIAKAGGLADVVGSLPKALKKIGVEASVIIPFYKGIDISKDKAEIFKKDIPVDFQGEEHKFHLWKSYLPKSEVPLFLIENERVYSKEGIYVEEDASSGGRKEEALRFFFLSVAGIEAAKILKPDIFNCHDWHTAITPFLMKEKGVEIKSLLTIHNLGYQGKYPPEMANELLGTDFKDEINCLKLGIMNADFINTVSPNYAEEILTSEFGEGLEKYLQKRKGDLAGIVNGIDYDHFSPENDSFLSQPYSLETLDKRKANKEYLQKKYFKKTDNDIPILGIISRLAEQKGMDLVKEILPFLMKRETQLLLLGKGVKEYEEIFKKASQEYGGKLHAEIGFDEELAHQIYGGVDMFLMPSKFEPCGLGQQIAMRYGCVPIARAVGGIKDTVSNVEIKGEDIDGTGFLFEKYDSQDFWEVIQKALDVFEDKEKWRKIQIAGMKEDLTWEHSAKKYKELYEKII
ncbi:MAG: glycosyltransferase [Candidatus Nealsonbacteria bacterium]|nr:glycosyltransferase [Candidatus Nealsonbacteria bacterium]